MLPVVTPFEMQVIDATAPEPPSVLIERAGRSVARDALAMLGGAYGRRVVVLAGPGNNGADGRVAATVLRGRGVRVVEIDALEHRGALPQADLVIDAAFGTGLSRDHVAPTTSAPVLAVDIASGIDGLTGERRGSALVATRTTTFAAWKPGLLFGDGPAHVGAVRVADIGLSTASTTIHLVEDRDVGSHVPRRARDAHKWHSALLAIAGSAGMPGAARLVAGAAQRTGAGMVVVASPGLEHDPGRPTEAVGISVSEAAWASELSTPDSRFGAVVVGPGLGTSMVAQHQIRSIVSALDVPMVIDADGLTALGRDAADLLDGRISAAILTPHDGEFARLTGAPPGSDRIDAARVLASQTNATVLLKGPTTVVASPRGAVRLVRSGDERLATAGTGDVLAGIIGALLAMGCGALDAASIGAHIHGATTRFAPSLGLIASDLIAALPATLGALLPSGSGR